MGKGKSSKTIEIVLEINGQQVVATVKRVKGQFDQIEKAVGRAHKRSGGFLRSWERATIVMNQLLELMRKVGMMVRFIAKPLEEAALFETFRVTLKNLIGDVDEADRRFREMVDFAAKTPFTVPGIVEAGNRLQAVGRYSLETIKMLGDLAAASGKDVMQAVEAYTNLVTGRTGIAVKQFRAMLIATNDWVRTTGKQVLTTGKGVKASIEEMVDALPKIIEAKGFTGLMQEQSKTLAGMWTNLQDAIQKFLASFGDKQMGAAKKTVSALITLFNTLGENIEVVSATVEHLIKASVAWIAVFKGGAILKWIVSPLYKLNDALVKAGGALALFKANWFSILAGVGVAVWQVIDMMSISAEKHTEALLKETQAIAENLEKDREALVEKKKVADMANELIGRFLELQEQYKRTGRKSEEYLESLRDVKNAFKDITAEIGAVNNKTGDLTDKGLKMMNEKFIVSGEIVRNYVKDMQKLKEALDEAYKSMSKLSFKKAMDEFSESADDASDAINGLLDKTKLKNLTEEQIKLVNKYFGEMTKSFVENGKVIVRQVSWFDSEQFAEDLKLITEKSIMSAAESGEWTKAKITVKERFQVILDVLKDPTIWQNVSKESMELMQATINGAFLKSFDRIDAESRVYVDRITQSAEAIVTHIQTTTKGGLSAQLSVLEGEINKVLGRIGTGAKDYAYTLTGDLAKIYGGKDMYDLIFPILDPEVQVALSRALTDAKNIMQTKLENQLSTEKDLVEGALKIRKDALEAYKTDLDRINADFEASDKTEEAFEEKYSRILALQKKFKDVFVAQYTEGTGDMTKLLNTEFDFWVELLKINREKAKERTELRKTADEENLSLMKQRGADEKKLLDEAYSQYFDFIDAMKNLYDDVDLASLLEAMDPAEREYFGNLKKNVTELKGMLQDKMFFEWSIKLSDASLKGEEAFTAMLDEFIKATTDFQEYIPSVNPDELLDNMLETKTFDYRKAFKEKVFPEWDEKTMEYHWPSIAPSGATLKDLKNHPTGWKEIFMQLTKLDPDSVGVTDITKAQDYIQKSYDEAFTFEKYLYPEFILTPKFTNPEEEASFREYMKSQPWFEQMMQSTQEDYEILLTPIVDISKTEDAFGKLEEKLGVAKDLAMARAGQIEDSVGREQAAYQAEIDYLTKIISLYKMMKSELAKTDMTKQMPGEDEKMFDQRKALFVKVSERGAQSTEDLKALLVDFSNFQTDLEKETADKKLQFALDFSNALKNISQDIFRFQQEQATAEVELWRDAAQKKLEAEQKYSMGFARTKQQQERVSELYRQKEEELDAQAEQLKQEKLAASFAMYKTASIATAIIATYTGAAAALDPVSGYGPVLGLIMAGVIIAAGLANVAMIAQQELGNVSGGGGVEGFTTGGYTGSGSKDEPAGIVHKEEFVVKAEQTKKNLPLLEKINEGERIELSDLKNLALKDAAYLYKTGGLVRDLSESKVTPKGEIIKKEVVSDKVSTEDAKKSELGKISESDYARGGFTGKGKEDEIAGIVHKGEYVVNAEETRKNISLLENINKGKPVSISETEGIDFESVPINLKKIHKIDLKKDSTINPEYLFDAIGYKKGGFVGERVPQSLNDFISPQRIPVNVDRDFEISHILDERKLRTNEVNSDVLNAINRLNDNLEYYLKNPVSPALVVSKSDSKKIVNQGVVKIRRDVG